MLNNIWKLAAYGPITIEARRGILRLGVLVRLPGDVQTGFVSCYADKLYLGLEKLVEISKEEDERLWKIQRAPKQLEID